MIKPPTLLELFNIVNINISNKEDLGEVIRFLNKAVPIKSDDLKRTQYHLELAYIIITARQAYDITESI